MISEREEILKALRAGPLVLGRLVRGLPDDVVRARPAAGEWAIIEVVAHMADTDERSLARTERTLVEEEPILAAYDQAALAIERDYLSMDLGAQLARFAAIRDEQVRLLASLDDAGWHRVGLHDEHGRVTAQQLAAHTAGEDADHLAQIARMIPET